MVGGGVGRLGEASCGAVAGAVVLGAQERAALDDMDGGSLREGSLRGVRQGIRAECRVAACCWRAARRLAACGILAGWRSRLVIGFCGGF